MQLKHLFAAAALLGAVACNKAELTEQPSENGGCPVNITASADFVTTKVSAGEMYEDEHGKHIPFSWDASGEELNLSEFLNDARSQDVGSSSFTKISENNASFSFTLSKKSSVGTYDYVAISPKSAARTTGTAAAKKGRASFALAPTTAQKPLPSSPDPSAIIMTAKDLGHSAQAAKLNLSFEHQLAYSKMKITAFPELEDGENVTIFTITAPAGKYLSGRYWYNYSTGLCDEYEGSMANYVLVNPEHIEVNSTAFEIWWASMPVELSMGDSLSISATTSKGRTLSSKVVLSKNLRLEKGKVTAYTYNWTKCSDKVLKFDFYNWPSGWDKTMVSGKEYKYGDYTFVHYGYDTSGGTKNRCSYNSTSHFMTLNYGGFLSLPVLANHKLVKAVVKHSASKSSNRQGGVTYGVRAFPDSVEFVTDGGKSGALWNVTPGTFVELPILTSCHEHQYYICCTVGGLGIESLELTYEYDLGPNQAFEPSAFNVGNLNIWMPSARTTKKEAGLAPAEREWEYARYNIRDIIKDGAFDILGVQEATLRVRNDIKTDLNSLNKYDYQYFLHKPSVPSSSSSTGFVYNKNRFSISDTHQFWLSDTPDVPESVDPDEDTPRSCGSAVFTDSTTGRRYFVMVAHASLNDDANARDADRILAKIKEYNTLGLPVILVGDLNANWNMPMHTKLCGTMADSRFVVELDHAELMTPGTHNGSAGIYENLKERANRIDYIFTQSCQVYDYKVLRNKYSAGSTMQYPSDHCPPVIRCY